MCSIGYGAPLVILLLSVIVSYIFVMSPTADEMANNGFVFISNAAKAHVVCQRASKFVRRVLYVKVKDYSDNTLPVLSKQIENVYGKASTQYGHLDIRLMLKPSGTIKVVTNTPIDMILYDSDLAKDIDILKNSISTVQSGYKMQSIDCQESPNEAPLDNIQTYENVALGGTFDRLHNGHKILLSQAALRATKLVTVGVTDVNLIQSKTLYELIQPVEVRMKEVLNFLNDINPDLEYNVFPLQDLYGPTKDDPKYQLIIVSEETLRGATKINEKRVENGLRPMDVHVIALAQDEQAQGSQEEENKISSSNQRIRMLGTLLKPPTQPNADIPDWPYVIGLAGGIGSGKSNITKYLKEMGAATVNCDIIAHELYKPGLPLNKTLSENFGEDIITETGEVDRKKLGKIVFSDKEQLEKLNRLVWPAVMEEAKRQIQELGKEGYRVVVMEAAVMVKAKWFKVCHQIWAVIIPRDEAIKRIQDRDNLSPEDAANRVDSQVSNQEHVALANVVFSPLWSFKHTRGQVDGAWNQLQDFLNSRK